MRNIYIYCCLLPALSIVEMKPVNIVGHVGENVSFTCSNWDGWTSGVKNIKYLCNDPCNEDKDIIIKAEYGKTKRKDRIGLLNKKEGLFVTFFKLQKSDSKKYICGLERIGYDSYIEVNLKVTDAILGSTMSPLYPNLSTTSSELSATQGAVVTVVLCVSLVGVVLLTGIIMLPFYKPRTGSSGLRTNTDMENNAETAGPDSIYQTLSPATKDQDQVYSTVTPSERVCHDAVPESIYQSLNQATMEETYSTVTPSKRL